MGSVRDENLAGNNHVKDTRTFFRIEMGMMVHIGRLVLLSEVAAESTH